MTNAAKKFAAFVFIATLYVVLPCTLQTGRVMVRTYSKQTGDVPMKILVKWWCGRRDRADFRMLLSSDAIERKSLAMLGEEQWIKVTLPPNAIERVRALGIEALACDYVKHLNPQLRCDRTEATVLFGPEMCGTDAIGTIIMIDLGEVVYA